MENQIVPLSSFHSSNSETVKSTKVWVENPTTVVNTCLDQETCSADNVVSVTRVSVVEPSKTVPVLSARQAQKRCFHITMGIVCFFSLGGAVGSLLTWAVLTY